MVLVTQMKGENFQSSNIESFATRVSERKLIIVCRTFSKYPFTFSVHAVWMLFWAAVKYLRCLSQRVTNAKGVSNCVFDEVSVVCGRVAVDGDGDFRSVELKRLEFRGFKGFEKFRLDFGEVLRP